MALFKIAGRNDSGNASSFSLNDSGEAKVQHQWKFERISLINSQTSIRSTDDIWTDTIDVSKFATFSLRISSSLDQPVAVNFGYDGSSTNTSYLKNYGGSNIGFTIPSDFVGVRMITPEDIPNLQYIGKIRLKLQCSTAPTSGSVSISIFGKY